MFVAVVFLHDIHTDPVYANALTGAAGKNPPPALQKGLDLLRGSPPGKTDVYDVTFTGSAVLDAVEALVRKMSAAEVAMFDLSRVFSAELGLKGSSDQKPSQIAAKDVDIDRIEKLSDIKDVLPSEHALPDEIFYRKAADRSLMRRTHTAPEEGRQLLYSLLDTSGSMGNPISANSNGLITRGNLASALLLALIRRAIKENNILYLRMFAGIADKLRVGDDEKSLLDMARIVGLGDFNGGGTNISRALGAAMTDIGEREAREKITKAEVLLISDLEDDISADDIDSVTSRTKLHVLDVLAPPDFDDDYKQETRKLFLEHGTNFFQADPNEIDPAKIVQAIQRK